MKVHTTNYFNTLILVAEDCPVGSSQAPLSKHDTPTIATLQYELIRKNPYKYTSDDILFLIYKERNDITESEWVNARETLFSKGQPCLRSSPLGKKFGWGIHSNEEGKIALYGMETEGYKKLEKDEKIIKVKAMRSKREA